MHAEVAELVDAHDSGSCARKGVEVRVFSSAFSSTNNTKRILKKQSGGGDFLQNREMLQHNTTPNFIYNDMNCLLSVIPFSIFYRVSCRVSVLQIFFKLDRPVKILA